MDDDSNKVKSALAQLGTVIEDLSKREVPSAGAIAKRVLEHLWDSETRRLGIGTKAPNAILSIASLEAEFIVDVDQEAVHVGTWTTDDLHIITDDTARISVTRAGKITLGTRSKPTETTVYGALNVNVNNPTGDVDIETAGPIRIAGRKFSVGSDAPKAGSYRQGDIVWNDISPLDGLDGSVYKLVLPVFGKRSVRSDHDKSTV
jgi:hypothetical protein